MFFIIIFFLEFYSPVLDEAENEAGTEKIDLLNAEIIYLMQCSFMQCLDYQS